MSTPPLQLSCPAPLLAASNYSGGGYVDGRFCGNLTADLSCCMPCPSQRYFFSDDFERNLNVAYWLNVPALACQIFLLLTFLVLPNVASHWHYLSFGLVFSLMLYQLAFIVPLATRPNPCYDDITPNDMHTSMSCAWTGALSVAGTMAFITWVFLRALWTHLKVCWDVQESRFLFWLSQVIGWGTPALFLALTIPITGVSYRLGTSCLPNQHNALATFIVWLLIMSCLAAIVQVATTTFCFWLYWRQKDPGYLQARLDASHRDDIVASTNAIEPPPLASLPRRNAWRRTWRVLKLQWRTILLTMVGILETTFFSAIFLRENNKLTVGLSADQQRRVLRWVLCYIKNDGDGGQCQTIAQVLGLDEKPIIACYYVIAVVGILTFLLLIRRSMFTGWTHLLLNPSSLVSRQRINHHSTTPALSSPEDMAIPKRKSFGRPLESEKLRALDLRSQPKAEFLPSPGLLSRDSSMPATGAAPQLGAVTRPHETDSRFDETEEDELEWKRFGKVEDGGIV